MTLRKTLTATALASGVAFAAQAADMPGEGVTVQAIQSPIAEETFQTMLVNEALRDLGYDVQDIQEVDYSAGYTSVANGDATYMAVNWYPLHNTMYKNAGGDDTFFRQGHYITGAAQGYLIDKKTAEEHGIDNLEDFKKPEVAKLFDTDGDGKADLTGCQAGWGCEGVIEHQLDAFELRDSITHKQGQYAAIISDTITRYENGESIFYYTWTPYWVSGILVPGKDVVWLEVPYSANPNGTDTELPNGKNYGFEINSERIVANKEWAEENPAAAKLFEVMELSVNDVSAQNMKIREGEDSQEEIMAHTKAWIQNHQDTYNGWLEAARAAAE
ncbi:glycine betaine/L-proline ABC transporter substrate-binding protein ProX [Marinobacter nanhaiticus D15-8W]|uniref:Proline/glycine betaine ABC transporter substrate-binding protein ProX n=1 Tax=Marinobacter nanhaiticus D15-8W TaxID=626887 RepID=N6W4N4_9GAMM|nr:glycine betaine/L-proline ABC transporter substrate-binding protein ProX [Marinobacter nanhaiticus]ENO15109.1 proline/glycine betaine ABC transporter substrate-binding protein ProX [Marinobacter nanhaiticus D15-8W]BES69192.1 glycine betaine/L-proline ABC transporter substrate-binding protein ProX [Marinobacter nanhaiticus D15-8W]